VPDTVTRKLAVPTVRVAGSVTEIPVEAPLATTEPSTAPVDSKVTLLVVTVEAANPDSVHPKAHSDPITHA